MIKLDITSHTSKHIYILSQFKCELSYIQRIEALNSFSNINGANNVISEKLNQTYGVQLEQKETLIPSNSFIAQVIKKVICEANRNTPSISIHRLKVVLAGCFANSITEIKELTGKAHCFIMRWLSRFLEDGIYGLKDKQHSGRPLSYDDCKLLINIKELLKLNQCFLAEKI